MIVLSSYTWYRLLPLVFRGLGASDVQVSVSFALISAGATFLQYPGGILSDRLGRKPLIVFPTYGTAFFYLIASFSTHWIMLAAMVLAANLCMALQGPSFVSLIAESAEPRQRSKSFGIFNFFISLALALGPALGALLLGFWSVKMLMRISALVFLMAGYLRQRNLREPRKRTQQAGKKSPSYSLSLFRLENMRKLLLMNIFYTITMNLTLWGPFISLFAEDRYLFGRSQINILFACGSIAAAAISLAGGRLTERLGAKAALGGGLLLHTLIIVVWLASGRYFFGVVVMVAANMFYQVSIIAYDTLRSACTDDDIRATALGLVSTISGIIGAGVVPVAGYLKNFCGDAAPFLLAPIAAALALFFAGQLKTQTDHTDKSQAVQGGS